MVCQDSLFVTVTVTDVEEAGRSHHSAQARVERDDFPEPNWKTTTMSTVELSSWQWQRSSNRSSWGDISGATSISYTAGADDINQYLRAKATYEDDRGPGKEASLALAGRIGDSNDRPTTNSAPEFSDPTAERSVGQGTGAGRNIGAPVRATDDDNGDILTYSLRGLTLTSLTSTRRPASLKTLGRP